MCSIQEFVQYVEQQVFPSSIQSLRQCQSAQELSEWRKVLCKELYAKFVLGEVVQNMINQFNPQEERKDDLNLAQRVYMETEQLEDDQKSQDVKLQQEQQKLREKQLALEQIDQDLDEMKPECDLVAKAYKEKLVKMVEARDLLRDQVKKIVSDAENEIIKTVREARSRLAAKLKPANEAPVVQQPQQVQQQPANQPVALIQPQQVQARQKVFRTKESGHCVDKIKHQPDFYYPPTNELSYERFIVGFEQRNGDSAGVNIIMNDGSKSNLALNWINSGWTQVAIDPAYQTVKKIVLNSDSDSRLGGIKLFDKDGIEILKAANPTFDNNQQILLAEGERLVGVKSKVLNGIGSKQSPQQLDFQFIIGWLE